MGQGDHLGRERRSDPTSFRQHSTHFLPMPAHSCRLFSLRHSVTNRFRLLTSHRLPYVVEVNYDGSAIFRQPPEMDLTPASNVLSYPFTGRLRPRHFAGECAHKPRAVSLHDQTVSKGKV